MEWLWIILRYLFPHDRVRQGIEAVRRMVGDLALRALSDDSLDRFAHDPESRRYLEAHIIAHEANVRAVIAARACQIAGVVFRPSWEEIHLPARAKSFIHVLARLNDLFEMCDDIERLARLRAVKLRRMREADPLGLAAHGSTDAALRAAAHHEAVGVAEFLKAQSGLIPSSTRSVRRVYPELVEGSKDEAVLTITRSATPRAPPVFDVCQNHPTRLAGFTCEAATRSAGHRFELLRIIQRKTVATAARANQVQTKAARANKQVAASPPYAHL